MKSGDTVAKSGKSTANLTITALPQDDHIAAGVLPAAVLPREALAGDPLHSRHPRGFDDREAGRAVVEHYAVIRDHLLMERFEWAI